MGDNTTLARHHSTFGCYAVFLLILMSFSTASFYYACMFSTNFLGLRSDHWCHVPELANHSQQEQIILGIPWENSRHGHSQCTMYAQPRGNLSTLEDTHVEWDPAIISCQTGWNYDTTFRESTYIMEWDIVCKSSWLSDIVAPIQMLGIFLGSFTWSIVADRIGRKKTMISMYALFQLSGLAAAYSPNIYVFIALRFTMVYGAVSAYTCVYILGGELIDPKYRFISTCINSCAVAGGFLVLTLYAYFIPQWRTLGMALAVSGFPLLVAMVILVPESPVWLCYQGRYKEAIEIWTSLAYRNGKPIQVTDAALLEMDSKKEDAARVGSYRTILTDTTTRRCFATISVTWTMTAFINMAFTYNVDFLFGDPYFNACAIGIMEIVAKLLAMFFTGKIGRMPIIIFCVVTCTLTGVFGIAFIYIEDLDAGITALVVLSRSCGAIINYTMYTMVLELFPTSVGSSVMGMGCTISNGFSLVAPYMAGSLTLIWAPTPYATICVVGMLALGLNLCWLPETRGAQIPESVDEMSQWTDRTWLAMFCAWITKCRCKNISECDDRDRSGVV